jgi:hypothetical protein
MKERGGGGEGSGQCVARGRRRVGVPPSGKRAGVADAMSGRRDRGPERASKIHGARGPAGSGLPGWLREKGMARQKKNRTLFIYSNYFQKDLI